MDGKFDLAFRTLSGVQLNAVGLTWSRTWLFVVLYFSAMASATALVPTNRVFQLWELREKKVRGMSYYFTD